MRAGLPVDYRNGVDLGRNADREAAAQYERFPGLNEKRAMPFQTVVLDKGKKVEKKNEDQVLESRAANAETPRGWTRARAVRSSLLCRGKNGMVCMYV